MENRKKQKFNKEIYALRLAITTECVLDCKYCFVDKDKRVMSLATAKKAVNFLLESPGREKLLIIYGGEPLIHWILLKSIIKFYRQRGKKLRKNVMVSVGTNAILLNKSRLEFFKKYDVKLAISMDGTKKIHDRARVYSNKAGSFDKVIKNIPLAIGMTKKQNISVLFGVLPDAAGVMLNNLNFLVSCGFKNINVEPIQSSKFIWRETHKKLFYRNLSKFINHIYKNIPAGNFIFLNSINRELRNNRLSGNRRTCPIYENIEIYPDGEMSFSPFLINSRNKINYLVGDISRGMNIKYSSCLHSYGSPVCQACWSGYDDSSNNYFANDVLHFRNLSSIYTAEKIRERSKNRSMFKKYSKIAAESIFE